MDKLDPEIYNELQPGVRAMQDGIIELQMHCMRAAKKYEMDAGESLAMAVGVPTGVLRDCMLTLGVEANVLRHAFKVVGQDMDMEQRAAENLGGTECKGSA